jgi:ubiquinone/menaquinone biosynthesis C-methylase UbiE
VDSAWIRSCRGAIRAGAIWTGAVTGSPEGLFASAVTQYARYRPGYPARELNRLADLVGLDRSSTVIDIGCGTGQLTIPLAERAGTVIAVDPLDGMLAAGRARALAHGLTNISWRLGDADAIESLVPPGADLATFAASFHWTDRAEVLRSLDRMLGPGAHVVTINDDLDAAAEPDWVHAANRLRDEFLGSNYTAGTDQWRNAPVSHRQIIEASPFAEVQELHWEWERQLTVDAAVGLQFTYSYSTPAVFGPRAAEFASQARAAILALYPGGTVTEPFRMEVLIARRP